MLNITENIKKVIVVNPGERPVFLKLLIHSFLIGLAYSFFLVQASGNFISKVGIAEIPIAYIFSGIIGLFIIQLFKKIQFKYGNVKSYQIIVLFFALSTSVISLGQMYFSNDTFVTKLIAYFGFQLIFVFLTLFSLGFTSVCTINFSFSQSKRLIALLGSGEVFASILGILIIPILKQYNIGNNYILFLAVFFALISLLPIKGTQTDTQNKNQSNFKKNLKPFQLNFFIKNKYVLFLSITAIISIASYYFIDYSYMVSVRYLSELTRVEIINIVAFYLFASKLGELFFSLFSKNIIYSIGTESTLLLQPFLLLFFAAFGILCFFVFPASPLFIVIFLLINKWIGTVIRKNITVPVRKIMFQMNSAEDMNYLQNNIEGVITQIATIFFGALLYLICININVKNYQTFTTIITALNFIIFLLYLIYSKKLYTAYKAQIKAYLNTIYTAFSSSQNAFKNPDSKIILSPISKENSYYEKLNSLFKNIDLSNHKQLISLICFYNPNFKINQHSDGNDFMNDIEHLTKLKKLYFENHNFLSRLVILTYLFNYDHQVKSSFLKEIYSINDTYLNMYFLDHLCNDEDVDKEMNKSFYNEKLVECIEQIMWIESAIYDLSDDSYESIKVELATLKNQLIIMLLNFLQIMNEKKTIQIVKNIFNKLDKTEDDMIFIVELLENILDPESKKIILPIFEPIGFITKANKLKNIYLINTLSPKERLIDILMYKFNHVSSYLKQLALMNLKTNFDATNIVQAFSSSQIINIKMEANHDELNLPVDYIDYEKIKISNDLSSTFHLNNTSKVFMLQWGFRNLKTESYKKNNNESTFNFDQYSILAFNTTNQRNEFEIDLVAPYLLSKFQQVFSGTQVAL
jgi:hypothetical protein